MRNTKNQYWWLSLIGLLLLFPSLSSGQVRTGAIYGKVTDEQGGVLPGVTVTLTSDLIPARTVTTTGLGVYRFPELPAGMYSLGYSLTGFQTLYREEIPVSVGSTVVLDVALTIGSIEEVVTVGGESPVVDTRHTNIGASLDDEILANIPSSRDPWTILAWVPHVTVDRLNVGGTESGQQSNFMGAGSMNSQSQGGSAQWSIDGVVITDMAANGSSPTYYDFDSFQEIEISSGGHEAQIPYGGIGINFITKQGGNSYSGQAAFYGTGEDMQSQNTPETEEFDDVSTNKVNKIRDWGFDVGGPIAEDRAWFWGAFRNQDIDITVLSRTFEPPVDKTTLENYNLKFHGMVTEDNKATFLWTRGNKIKDGRGAGAQRPTNTTWDQSGPTNVYKIEDQHVFSDEFILSGSYGYVGGGFQLIAKGGQEVPVILDLTTGVWGNTTFIDHFTDRPQQQVRVDGNYYVAEAMGGDHEFKFGFLYRDTSTTSASVYGNGNFLLTLGADPYLAYLYRDKPEGGAGDFAATYTGVYVSDTYSRDRLTLNLGVRYDIQTTKANPSTVGANPVIPDLLPAIDFPGFESNTDWKDISPRIGATYDLAGDGKTILRGNFATYAAGRQQTSPDAQLQTTGIAAILFLCEDPVCSATGTGPTDASQLTDLNGNGVIDGGDALDWFGTDPFNPGGQIIDTFDPDFGSPKSLEVIVGVEHELMPDFAIGGNLIYRRNWNLVWSDDFVGSGTTSAGRLSRPLQAAGGEFTGDNPGAILTAADYEPVTVDGVTFYRLKEGVERGAGSHTMNRPNFHNTYTGFEITARKRLSNSWMLNGSFTWRDWTNTFDCFDSSNPTSASADCYQDPTNTAALDGNWIYQETGGSGKSDLWLGSKWQFKIGGMYEFPYGIHFSGFLTGQQGSVFPQTDVVAGALRGQLGIIDAFRSPWDENRYENLWYSDLRLEKAINMDFGRLDLILDMFNVGNTNTVLGREVQQSTVRAGGLGANELADTPLEIVNPRIFRFGVRIRF